MRNIPSENPTEIQRRLERVLEFGLIPRSRLLLVDLAESFGPFLRLQNGQTVFDLRATAPRIGYNASPLFGTLHKRENWHGSPFEANESYRTIQTAFDNLLKRVGISETMEPLSPAQQHRNYIETFIQQQYADQAATHTTEIETKLNTLQKEFPFVQDVESNGLGFSFSCSDEIELDRLLGSQVEHGLLLGFDGQKLRFTLNLGFRKYHLEQLWSRLKAWLASRKPVLEEQRQDAKTLASYEIHKLLLQRKLSRKLFSRGEADKLVIDYLRRQLQTIAPEIGFAIEVLDHESYPEYRQQILDMQSEVYEPARQTSAEEFDTLFDREKLGYQSSDGWVVRRPLAILLLVEERVVAMAFSGPLQLFPETGGAETDPYRQHPMTYYMLDLTVVEDFRGKLGRLMKNAVTLLAMESNVEAIHGRNRDQLARGMWAINLSLGSFELQHLEADYDDDHEFRDCIYYRCPLRWDPSGQLTNGSRGNQFPTVGLRLSDEFYQSNMKHLINGSSSRLTISPDMLLALDYFASFWPKDLRHVIATCRSSAAISIAWQALKHRQSDDDRPEFMIVVKGLELGEFEDCEVIQVANPCESGKVQYLEQLAAALKSDTKRCTGVIVEPILSATGDRISEELLRQTQELCRDHHTAFVLAESMSLLYRYDHGFSASSLENLNPDIAIAVLGASFSVVLGNRAWQPKTFYHGGDPIELFGYNEVLRSIARDRDAYFKMLEQFDSNLEKALPEADRFRVRRGVGWIEGDLNPEHRVCLDKISNNRFLVCPSVGQIRNQTLPFFSKP